MSTAADTVDADAAQETRQEEMLEAALSYAKRGWHILRVYPPEQRCKSPGKEPMDGEGWQHKTTCDEREVRWKFKDRPDANVGILWGEKSGVVDCEIDVDKNLSAADAEKANADAEKAVGELFDGEACPSYAGKRGVHRICQWQPGLIGKPWVKFYRDAGVWRAFNPKTDPWALECRVGNNGAAQSVAPPSRHETPGVIYHWLPGCSPDDINPPKLPAALVKLLTEHVAGGNGKASGGPHRNFDETIQGTKEGDRNNMAASFIGSLLENAIDIETDKALKKIWALAKLWNEQNTPPLTETELGTVWGSILRREREKRFDDMLGDDQGDDTKKNPSPETNGAAAPSDATESPSDATSAAAASAQPDEAAAARTKRKQKALRWLTKHRIFARIGLIDVLRDGKTNCTFELVLRDGTNISLGTIKRLSAYAMARQAICEASDEALHVMRTGAEARRNWQKIADYIVWAARPRDLGIDDKSILLRYLGEMTLQFPYDEGVNKMGHVFARYPNTEIDAYLKSSPPTGLTFDLDCRVARLVAILHLKKQLVPEMAQSFFQSWQCFIWDKRDGSLIVKPEFAAEWMKKYPEPFNLAKLMKLLAQLEFTDCRIQARQSGGKMLGVRVWRSPPNFTDLMVSQLGPVPVLETRDDEPAPPDVKT